MSEKRNKDTEVRATEQFREDLNAMIRAQVTDLNVDELEAVQSLPVGRNPNWVEIVELRGHEPPD